MLYTLFLILKQIDQFKIAHKKCSIFVFICGAVPASSHLKHTRVKVLRRVNGVGEDKLINEIHCNVVKERRKIFKRKIIRIKLMK